MQAALLTHSSLGEALSRRRGADAAAAAAAGGEPATACDKDRGAADDDASCVAEQLHAAERARMLCMLALMDDTDRSKSERRAREACATLRRALGAEHSDAARASAVLARVLLRGGGGSGAGGEAAALLREAAQQLNASLGAQHPDALITAWNAAAVSTGRARLLSALLCSARHLFEHHSTRASNVCVFFKVPTPRGAGQL